MNRREGKTETVRGASGRVTGVRRVDLVQCVDLNKETISGLKTDLRADRLKNDRQFFKLRQQRGGRTFYLTLSHPPPSSPSATVSFSPTSTGLFLFPFVCFIFLDSTSMWNHTTSVFLCSASSTWHNAHKAHPRRRSWQDFLLLYD